MSVFDRLKRKLTSTIIKLKAADIIGLDQAILIFTNPQSGRLLEFPVDYEQTGEKIFVLFPVEEACRKKFEHGAPVKIFIKGQTHNAWATILNADEVFDIDGLQGTKILQKFDEMKDEKIRKYCLIKVKIS